MRYADKTAETDSLLQRLAVGDTAALESFYEQTRTAVYGLALSILRHPADAEDVTQDTYLRICETAAQYRPAGKPLAWVLTVTRNLCYDRLRNDRHTAAAGSDVLESLAAPVTDPEDALLLRFCLTTLSDGEREVVMLHAVCGLRHREIAALLKQPLSTVLSRYHRARRKLQRQLGGEPT